MLRSHFLIKKQVSVKSGLLRFKRCQIIGCSKKVQLWHAILFDFSVLFRYNYTGFLYAIFYETGETSRPTAAPFAVLLFT